MSRHTLRKWAAGTAMAATAVALAVPGFAETKVGSTVESRVLLGFKVDDAAMQDWLPGDWVPFTLPSGPVAGSNLIVAMIDRHVILDGEGAPGQPASGPTVALLAYGRQAGVEGIRGFVTRVYEEPPVVNPYGNSVTADIDRSAGYTDAGGGVRTQTETWSVLPEAGGELSLEFSFNVGGYKWSEGGESRPYSAVNPDFFRIYRYDQLVGLAMSAGMGLDLNGSVSFSVTDPDLAKLFDGSEALVSIMAIPTYVREISLP